MREWEFLELNILLHWKMSALNDFYNSKVPDAVH